MLAILLSGLVSLHPLTDDHFVSPLPWRELDATFFKGKRVLHIENSPAISSDAIPSVSAQPQGNSSEQAP